MAITAMYDLQVPLYRSRKPLLSGYPVPDSRVAQSVCRFAGSLIHVWQTVRKARTKIQVWINALPKIQSLFQSKYVWQTVRKACTKIQVWINAEPKIQSFFQSKYVWQTVTKACTEIQVWINALPKIQSLHTVRKTRTKIEVWINALPTIQSLFQNYFYLYFSVSIKRN